VSRRKNLNAPEHWAAWLRACLRDVTSPIERGIPSLAVCTGQDDRALHAFAACLELYAASDDPGRQVALGCLRALLDGMQRSCWPLARELIAQQLDWSDRETLWPRIQGLRE